MKRNELATRAIGDQMLFTCKGMLTTVCDQTSDQLNLEHPKFQISGASSSLESAGRVSPRASLILFALFGIMTTQWASKVADLLVAFLDKSICPQASSEFTHCNEFDLVELCRIHRSEG